MMFIHSVHTKSPVRNLFISSLLCLAFFLLYKSYEPGLAGSFVFDDNPNIVSNSSLQIQHIDVDHLRQAALSSSSGLLKRPISMLSFAANYSLTGQAPYYFKITNLAIHAVNGFSLYFLTLLLLQVIIKRLNANPTFWQIQFIALATAIAWMMHPLNLTSVLYVVQRMTSLSAAFTIWGLILFTMGRIRLRDGRKGYGLILLSLILFTPLATMCKENGVLLPAYMLALELSLFRFEATTFGKRFLAAFFGASILLPALCFLIFVALHPSWLVNSYVGRAFSLDERLMTEARILWFYLREIVAPDTVQMGLFHDDIANSRTLFAPLTTLTSIVGLIFLLVLSWLARKKAPLISFAILFFFAGHLLESSIFPLEIAHEHRNYLPMYGIILAIFYYLLYPFKYLDTLRLRQIAGVMLIALFAYDTWSRATHWSSPFELARYEVENHPNSARDNGDMGNNYASIRVEDPAVKEAYYSKAKEYFEKSAAVDPDYTNGLFAILLIDSRSGREIDPKLVTDLKRRLEFSTSEPDTGDKLTQLVVCNADKKCHLDNQTILDFINAALKNRTTVGDRRSLILSSLTYYLIDLASDYPQALDVLRQIVRNSPQQIEYRMTLVKLLIALQKPEEAKQELAAIRQQDQLNAYTPQIEQIEQQLGHK